MLPPPADNKIRFWDPETVIEPVVLTDVLRAEIMLPPLEVPSDTWSIVNGKSVLIWLGLTTRLPVSKLSPNTLSVFCKAKEDEISRVLPLASIPSNRIPVSIPNWIRVRKVS